ncbi:hypothetical protein QQ045_019782 [Rhodiola kirilowii]
MASMISNKLAAILALTLSTLMLFSIPKIESLAEGEDPLALAPTIAYDMPPIFPPVSQEPDAPLEPSDPDFPSFKTKNAVDVFLLDCQKRSDFDLKCGWEYHAAVFKKDVKPVAECCHKLVKQGKKCHELLTRYVLRFGGYNYDREVSLKRSERLWEHCIRV